MKALFWTILLTATAIAEAQSVRMMPDLALAESEYRDAQEAWLKSDPNLERDLYRTNPEEMRRRIRRAASLRDDVMAKKEAYLGFLVVRFDQIKSQLLQTKDAKLPTKELKSSLEQDQERLLSEQERVEGLIREMPQGDEYFLVRRAMESEKTDLIGLHNNIALRIRSLDKAAVAQQAASDFAAPLEAKLDELKQMWVGERNRAVTARATWARLYNGMEQSLDGRKGLANPPLPQNRVPEANPQSVVSVAHARSTLAGAWAYQSQPGAWTGFGEPDSVVLQLRNTGGSVEGTYVARLPGRHDMRSVNLTLQGRLVSDKQARVRWTSQRPVAHGEMLLRLSSDGRLLVQRLDSDDSYIPRGMEVLLPQ